MADQLPDRLPYVIWAFVIVIGGIVVYATWLNLRLRAARRPTKPD